MERPEHLLLTLDGILVFCRALRILLQSRLQGMLIYFLQLLAGKKLKVLFINSYY